MAAPMDGITDSPMRQIIRKFSPKELLFTEMRHITRIASNNNERTLQYKQIELPLANQVSANSTDFLEIAVEKIIEHKFSMLNLNAGCPTKNVIKSGCGSALMANKKLFEKLVKAFVKAINGTIPFSVKIRAGYKEKNGLEIAKLAQDCGADMIIIHPRTQEEGFSAPLDFDIVKKIKQKLSIPVIFSGEIKSFDDVKSTHEKTGCDGFMIGRALWGAPWKLKEISDQAEGKTFSISEKEIIELAIEHLDLSIEFYGSIGIKPFKTYHLPKYTKGLPQAATLRRTLLNIETHQEMKEKLKSLLSEL
jgi:nifR3 family TIM-barrel protein